MFTAAFWAAVGAVVLKVAKGLLGALLGEVEKVALGLWNELPVTALTLKAVAYFAAMAGPAYLAFGLQGLAAAAVCLPGVFVVNGVRILFKLPLSAE